MSKFKKEAQQLLEYVGGKENIQAVTHCEIGRAHV